MILFKSFPADCDDGIGYVSSTVMLDGLYPERTRCRAVDDPIVPPPPTTTTDVASLDGAMLNYQSLSRLQWLACWNGEERCRKSLSVPTHDVIPPVKYP